MFTVVGISTIAVASTTDPEDYEVPLPSGTEIGDLIVVGFSGAAGCIPTDARLNGVRRTGLSAPDESGAWGVATDLTDVQLQFTSFMGLTVTHPGFAAVVTLRGVGEPTTTGASGSGDPEELVLGEDGEHAAGIAFVCDILDASITTDASTEWTDLGEITVYDGDALYYSMRSSYWNDGLPIPELSLGFDPTGGSRFWVYFLWSAAAANAGSYLRQRQSPVRTPSRIRGTDLRHKQTPSIR